MTEVIIGALVALAIRDIVYEIVDRYQEYRHNKNWDSFNQYLEDELADDD
jgi:hypothetical protein